MRERYGENFSWVFIFILSLTFLICFVSPAGAERGMTDKTIKVGSVWDRTGPICNTTLPIAAGVEGYLKLINTRGGVNGRNFEIFRADGQYKVDKVIFEFKRLVNKENIFLLFGPGNTGGVLSLFQYVKKDNVPLISMNPSTPVLFPPRRLVFIPPAPRTLVVYILFDYIFNDLKMKKPKIAILYPNNEYGKAGLKAAQERAKFYNTKLIPVIMNFKETSAASQVMRMKKEGVDVVHIFQIPKTAAIFMKDALAYNFRPVIIGNDGTTSESMLSLVPREAVSKYVGINSYSAGYEDVPGVADLKKVVKQSPEFKKYLLNRDFACGVVLAKVSVEAFKRMGKDTTVNGFVKAMESLKDFDLDGLHAPVTFTPDRRHGSTALKLYKVDLDKMLFKAIGVRSPRKTP